MDKISSITGYKIPMEGPPKEDLTIDDLKRIPKPKVIDHTKPITAEQYPRRPLNGHIMSLVDAHPEVMLDVLADKLNSMDVQQAEIYLTIKLEAAGIL